MVGSRTTYVYCRSWTLRDGRENESTTRTPVPVFVVLNYEVFVGRSLPVLNLLFIESRERGTHLLTPHTKCDQESEGVTLTQGRRVALLDE